MKYEHVYAMDGLHHVNDMVQDMVYHRTNVSSIPILLCALIQWENEKFPLDKSEKA